MEDEDTIWPRNAVPKQASHIIKLADGSEDDNNNNMPGLAPVDDDDDDDDESEDDEEAPAESAEAELSMHPTKICRKFQANNIIESGFPKSGTHLSMHSSSPPLQSNISGSAVFMSLSAMPSTAKGRGMAVWFAVTWTPVTPSPQAIFTSMQRYALERRRWPVLIKLEMSMLLTRC